MVLPGVAVYCACSDIVLQLTAAPGCGCQVYFDILCNVCCAVRNFWRTAAVMAFHARLWSHAACFFLTSVLTAKAAFSAAVRFDIAAVRAHGTDK